MTQKVLLLLLIAFVLALGQGRAEEVYSNTSTSDEQTEEFTAHVGQTVTRTVKIHLSDIGKDPFDPVFPMLSSLGSEQSLVNDHFFLSIQGDDSEMFSASAIDTYGSSDSCMVSVAYSPIDVGTHLATLSVSKIMQGSLSFKTADVNLIGNATEVSLLPGDVNDDGQVNIIDVTALIDIILSGNTDVDADNADVDGNGAVNIMDVTRLIDIILGVGAVNIYSTILVKTTDGLTVEFLIDENTKLRIANPELIIETDNMMLTYNLEELAQLCYGQREVSTMSVLKDFKMPTTGTLFLYGMKENSMVEINCTDGRNALKECVDGTVSISLGSEPSGEYVVKADSHTIKIVKP